MICKFKYYIYSEGGQHGSYYADSLEEAVKKMMDDYEIMAHTEPFDTVILGFYCNNDNGKIHTIDPQVFRISGTYDDSLVDDPIYV